MSPLTIVFFGSGPFALPSLERLLQLGNQRPGVHVAHIVTRPDRPAGRGRSIRPTPVRQRARELGVEALAPESANDPSFLERLMAQHAPDLFIVADYGEFLRKRFRELPRIGSFNLHGSLLPKHRGAAPVAYAITGGDTVTGVTLFRIEKELDSGPIVDAIEVPIGMAETAGELEDRLAQAAADLLERAIDRFVSGAFTESPQDHAAASLAPKLTKAQGQVDWGAPADAIHNTVRAMTPWPGAYSFLRRRTDEHDERVRLHTVAVLDTEPTQGSSPGTVLEVTDDALVVACGRGRAAIMTLQRSGKQPLPAAAFVRGSPIAPGDFFTTKPARTGN